MGITAKSDSKPEHHFAVIEMAAYGRDRFSGFVT